MFFSDPQFNILTNDGEVEAKQHLNKMYRLQIESVENPSKDDMTEWDPELEEKMRNMVNT